MDEIENVLTEYNQCQDSDDDEPDFAALSKQKSKVSNVSEHMSVIRSSMKKTENWN